MKTAINYLQIQRDILLNNAAVAHAEGRHDSRDRLLDEANDLARAVEVLVDTTSPACDTPAAG